MSGRSLFFGLCSATWLALGACYDPNLVDCVVLCGDDAACPHGMRCSNGFCVASGRVCEAVQPRPLPPGPPESCEPVLAGAEGSAPVQLRCGALDRVERCDDASATWISAQTCEGDAPVCQNGACLACAPGATRCANAGAYQRCDASGAWDTETTTDCSGDNPRCAAGVCVSTVEVSVGGAFACARLGDGAIECWGVNDFGQLGAGDRVQRGSNPEAPPLQAVDLGVPAVRVSAGGAHACATLESGGLKCWGANGRGQLGLGDTEARGDEAGELGDALPNVDLGPSERALAVATGNSHTCVLLDGGQIKCFGANESGQLGIGDTEPRSDDADETGDALQAVDLGPSAAAIAVRAGHHHSCALLATGNVKCWGANEFGQLGLGDNLARGDEPNELGSNLPTADLGPSGLRAVDVSAGASHTCALLEDASVVCWGANGAGQLGTGDRASRGDTPTEGTLEVTPVDLGSAAGAAHISVGANHACALSNERGVSCWGANLFGALGRGDGRLRGGTPEDVGSNLAALTFGHADDGVPLRALGVSAGVDFSCVVLHTGTVKCWGENRHGQLGVGDTVTRGDDPDELGDALPSVAFE